MLSNPRERAEAFLRGAGLDHRGRTLTDILAMSDEELESTHDFIQWCFPSPEPSRFNAEAPVLSHSDLRQVGSDPAVRAGVERMLRRMLAFYGLETVEEGGVLRVQPGAHWKARSPHWARFPGHNDLRLTRILKSLDALGLVREARALQTFLLSQFAGDPQRIQAVSYWKTAI